MIEVQNIQSLYEKTMIKVCAMAVDKYNSNPAGALKFINDTSVQKSVLLEKYRQLTASHQIKRIEDLPIEEKKKLIAECEGFEEKVTMCRVLWLIKNIK